MKNDFASLSPEEKKRALFIRQKETLDLFLKNGAINEAQYRKSLSALREKMGFREESGEDNG